MNFTTIFAAALLVGLTSAARNIRRNRLYDVTEEFGRFDGSDTAFEILFRELSQDDLTMGFMHSMSYSMSMDTTTSAPTTTTTGTIAISSPAPSPSAAPIVPASPSPSPAPINFLPASPQIKTTTVTDSPTTNGADGCTFDSTAFENDASAEVLLQIDVETISDDTAFLDGLMDAILAALRDEFGLCLPSGSSRTLAQSRRRHMSEKSITGVTMRDTESPLGESCDAALDSNACHVVHASVVVYGKSQKDATNGANRVVTTLEAQDFVAGDIVDVRVAERDDTISNGVSSSNNELAVDDSASSRSSTTGLAIGLVLIGLAVIAIAVLVLSRPRHAQGPDASLQNEFEIEELELQEQDENETDDTLTVRSVV